MLAALAVVARTSKEYQGDGWGCAWWSDTDQAWQAFHSIRPIWEDDLPDLPPTRRLVAHARSAFRNEGVAIENNMPFLAHDTAFVFNGELRGVRLTVPGRIGAERLFRFVRQLGGDTGRAALERAVDVVARRTTYIRGMNFVVAQPSVFRVVSRFGEDPDYFTLHQSIDDRGVVISSAPFAEGPSSGIPRRWEPIANGSVLEIPLP